MVARIAWRQAGGLACVQAEGVVGRPLRERIARIAAIQARDYPLITGTVLVYTTAFVAINFAIDILYALIDPRIRFDE